MNKYKIKCKICKKYASWRIEKKGLSWKEIKEGYLCSTCVSKKILNK